VPLSSKSLSTNRLSRIVASSAENKIYDDLGRERYFHGVNVVYKGPPYYPSIDTFDVRKSFSRQDAEMLQNLTINSIRLGVEWVGFEPTKGKYEQAYLDKIMQIVQLCHEYGIYVLLDMHQDAYSEQFCGEGFPQWTVYPPVGPISLVGFPVPFKATPFTPDGSIPSDDQCNNFNWGDGYLTWALAKTFRDLYSNESGNLDAFAAFWKEVAKRFGGQSNVLGYELINEPWGGDQFYDPALLIPGIADHKNLEGAYDQIAQSIREVDNNTLIFFEGLTLDNGIVGFGHVPGGSEWATKSVLSYHWYEGFPEVLPIKNDMDVIKLSARRLGTASMLTEFDISQAADRTKTLASIQAAESELQSWMGWEYKSFVPKTGYGDSLWNVSTGEVISDVARLYSHTYASAVPGKTTSASFDEGTGIFTLTFAADPSIQGPLEIRYSRQTFYPNGADISIQVQSANTRANVAEVGASLLQLTLPRGMKSGEVVSVVVKPVESKK